MGAGVVRVDHKKPSAGAVRVRVKNDGSFCTLNEPQIQFYNSEKLDVFQKM